MKIKILTLISLVSVSMISVNAQTVVSPDVGEVRLSEVQDSAQDGAAVTSRIMQFKATVGSGETWIPLGLFDYGTRHRLAISCEGNSANSSGVCEFSLNWNGAITVHHLSQYNWQGHFQLYSYKVRRGQGVALKYTNVTTASNNNVYVDYSTATRGSAWLDHQPDAAFFATLTDEVNLIKGAMEEHAGQTWLEASYVYGFTFNRPIIFNQEISAKQDIVFTDGATLKGDVILDQAQGDISMGAFGSP